MELPYDSAIPLLGIYPRKLKVYVNAKTCTLMFLSAPFIITKKNTHQWVDKQNMVYSYNGILFSHKKEWSTDTHYDIDEPWKHYAKWKMPVTKVYILYDSIYRKYPE